MDCHPFLTASTRSLPDTVLDIYFKEIDIWEKKTSLISANLKTSFKSIKIPQINTVTIAKIIYEIPLRSLPFQVNKV